MVVTAHPFTKKGTNVAEVWPSLVSGNENYYICSVKWGRTSEWIEALLTKRRQHSGVKIKSVIGKVKVRNLLLKAVTALTHYDNLNKSKCIDLYVEIIRVQNMT